MKYAIYALLFFIIAPISVGAQDIERPPLGIMNEEEGGLVKELEQERLERIYRSAGTQNLSLLNYRALNIQKERNAARPSGTDGYVNLNGYWSQVPLVQSTWGMGRINCFTLMPGDPSTIFVGTPTGGLWKSSDNGNNWANLTSAMQVPGVSGICVNPNNTNVMYILTGSGSTFECQTLGVFKTTDGGVNWAATGLDTTYITDWYKNGAFNAHKLVMDPNNSSVLFAAMTNGLYRTADAGVTWSKVIDAIGVMDIVFHPTNSNVVYVTTAGRTLRLSRNNGVNFGVDMFLPKPAWLGSYASCTLAVSPAAADSVFFVATVDELVSGVYIDSAYIIRAKYNPGFANVTFNGYKKCFYGTGASSGYVASALRSYRDARLAISPTTTANMYIGGFYTYSSANYGNSWQFKANDASDKTVVHSDGSQIEYINGYVYTATDGGIYRQFANESNATSAWSILTGTMPIAQISKFGASQSNTTDFTLALQDNGCHQKTSSSYAVLNGGDGIMARMSPTNSSIYYFRSNDFITYRVKDGNTTNINPITEKGYGFLPFEVDQNTDTRLYTAYKNLYISTNYGTTWSTKTTGATNNNKLMAISKTNNSVIWLLEDGGDVNANFVLRHTSNGGTSFTTITLPAAIPANLISSIVISPFDENRVYLTVDGYNANAKVFVTLNGNNATPVWTNVSSNGLPNVPVYCLAYESFINNSIYVGTEIGVYYFNTSINRWIPFNNGMPVCKLSEFYINRTANKIIAATYGRGIFISDLYGTCPPALSLTGSQSGSLTYSAGTTLSSTAQLSGGEASRIKYYSQNVIFINPGFTMGTGTNFLAAIGPCGGSVDPFLNRLVRDTSLLKARPVTIGGSTEKKRPDTRTEKKPGTEATKNRKD